MTWNPEQCLTFAQARQRKAFESAYAQCMRQACPWQADGRTLSPLRRLFIPATG